MAAVETELERLARLLRSGAISADQLPVDEATEAQRAREAAAMRMRQAAMPEGGRQEGPLTAALSDPALLFNMSPLGMARDAMKSANEGDYGQAAMSAAPLLAMGAAPAVRGAGALMQSFPKTTAIGSGLAGMFATSEAGTSLNRAQRQELEQEQARARNAAELDAQKRAQEAEIEAQRRSQQMLLDKARREGDVAAQQAAAQAEIERQREAERYRQQEEVRQSQLPFREKYPGLATALPFAGTAAAMASPYAVRLGKALFNNSRVGQMEDAITRADMALASQSKPSIVRSLGELKASKGSVPTPEGPISAGPGSLAISAALPAEAALLPAEYDMSMLQPDNPNREAAKHILTDPTELAKRVVPGLLQGIPAATLGNKIPAVWPEKIPPNANMEGLIAALKASKPARSKRQAPATQE